LVKENEKRNKITDRCIQIQLDIEIFLCGLNTGVAQQLADLRNRHTSAPAKFGI